MSTVFYEVDGIGSIPAQCYQENASPCPLAPAEKYTTSYPLNALLKSAAGGVLERENETKNVFDVLLLPGWIADDGGHWEFGEAHSDTRF